MKPLFKEESHHFNFISHTQEPLNKMRTSAALCVVVESGWFVSLRSQF